MRSQEQQIFLKEQHQIAMIEPEIQYMSSKDNQNEYLSQFIYSQGSENIECNSNPKSDRPITKQIQSAVDISASSQPNAQNQVRNKRREKSYFHNFQKHLVITLRNVVKLSKCSKKSEPEYISYEMWNVFVKSTLFSKKFLYVLFGVYGNNDENEFSKNFLNDLGYMEIFAKYSQDNIRQAQKYLRKEIIKQFDSMNMKNYLLYRKLKRVDEFQKYIEQFLGQLRQGSVRKRLPKQRKINMVLNIKEDNTSPDDIQV